MDTDPFPAPDTVPSGADVAVIGGGLMGTATAYWLARRGQQVLLLEARRLAWGASGRNAGVFLAGLHPVEDPALVRSVLSEEAVEAGFDRTGHLALAASTTVFDQIRAEVGRRPPTAPPLYAIDRPACEEVLGMPISRRFVGGRWLPDGHVVHPARLVHGVATAAARHGARIATHTPVTRVEPAAGRGWIRVDTSRGAVRAQHVVYACNMAVTRFWPALRRFLTPVRGQVMATSALPPLFRPAMAVDFGSVYWRQTGDGAVVLGGCRRADERAETTDRERLNRRIQSDLTKFLPAAFPGFPTFRVRRRWAGIMDHPADGRPLVGAIPRADGQWVIAGFDGHGMPAGLGAGRALADELTTGRPSPVLASFDPARVAGWLRSGGDR
jgi:glycine/D-amino acid oxidase-like deaminating enzyme